MYRSLELKQADFCKGSKSLVKVQNQEKLKGPFAKNSQPPTCLAEGCIG